MCAEVKKKRSYHMLKERERVKERERERERERVIDIHLDKSGLKNCKTKKEEHMMDYLFVERKKKKCNIIVFRSCASSSHLKFLCLRSMR